MRLEVSRGSVEEKTEEVGNKAARWWEAAPKSRARTPQTRHASARASAMAEKFNMSIPLAFRSTQALVVTTQSRAMDKWLFARGYLSSRWQQVRKREECVEEEKKKDQRRRVADEKTRE